MIDMALLKLPRIRDY